MKKEIADSRQHRTIRGTQSAHKVFPQIFISSDKKSGCTSCTPALCGIALISAVFLLLCASCSTVIGQQAAEPTPATATDTTRTAAASESNARLATATPPASQTNTETDTSLYETAKDYIGCPVEELYAAIGEPLETQYATSCDQENAEDGMLFYDNFYVWSLKTEDDETVYDVYLDD